MTQTVMYRDTQTDQYRLGRALNVELVGQARETGYVDTQWLIQRNGRFLQISELLYRIIEQADGERSVDEIAHGVSEHTEWLVSGEDVRHVADTKLVPLGLLTLPGNARPPVAAEGQRR